MSASLPEESHSKDLGEAFGRLLSIHYEDTPSRVPMNLSNSEGSSQLGRVLLVDMSELEGAS